MVGVKLSEAMKSETLWVSAEGIRDATGHDITPLIVGLSQSVVKTPDNKYLVRLKDLEEHLVLIQEVASLLGVPSEEKKDPREKPEKINATRWLPAKKLAKEAKVPFEGVVKLIKSGDLPAKKWGRGWLVDPKESKRIPELLRPPGPNKGGNPDPGSGPDQNHQKDLEGSMPAGSKGEDTGLDLEDPDQNLLLSGSEKLYSREGPEGETRKPDQGKDDDVPPPFGQDDQGKSGAGPVAAYVSITVRGEKGCLISDVVRELNVREDAIRRWITRKAVKTMGDEEHLDPESLKAFLMREKPGTVVNFIRHRGAPRI